MDVPLPQSRMPPLLAFVQEGSESEQASWASVRPSPPDEKHCPCSGGPDSTNKRSRCRHRLLLVSPHVSREPNTSPGRKTKSCCKKSPLCRAGSVLSGGHGAVSLTKLAVRLLSSSRARASHVKSLLSSSLREAPASPNCISLSSVQSKEHVFLLGLSGSCPPTPS